MINASVKLLIYDLLDLIDKNNFESCKEIENKMNAKKLVPYLQQKYTLSCLSKMDVQEVIDLLYERRGCKEVEYENGLIYLIDILLDCE